MQVILWNIMQPLKKTEDSELLTKRVIRGEKKPVGEVMGWILFPASCLGYYRWVVKPNAQLNDIALSSGDGSGLKMEKLEDLKILEGPLGKNRGTKIADDSPESKTMVKLGYSFVQLRVHRVLHTRIWFKFSLLLTSWKPMQTLFNFSKPQFLLKLSW